MSGYSVPWEGDDNPLLINDPRYSPAGVLAPKARGDMAFIMHSLSWLSASGTAAIVCYPGIMYRSGTEKKIRKYLIENNFIDCVIQLPANLFLNVPGAVNILLLRKNKIDNSILFVDASGQFVKETKNNRLSEENITAIVEAVSKKEDKEHFAYLASFDEIKKNDFKLSVSIYVEPEDTREIIDIKKLNLEIAEIVRREEVLRAEIDKIIAEIEGGHEND